MQPGGDVIILDIGSWAASAVGGTVVLALPIAFVAGLISFFSPCVIPLLPGYLAYTSGLAAADIIADRGRRRRVLVGTSLFVLGILMVFVTGGALFGTLGTMLRSHTALISRVLGGVIVALGLMFAGVLPVGRREIRLQRLPRAGAAAAPLLGVTFALGWTPCIGPTLGAVLTLGLNEGTAARGALLAAAFGLGLGVPFVVAGVAYSKVAAAVNLIRRHQRLVLRLGGAAMVAVGLLLITGLWTALTTRLLTLYGNFVPVI